MSLKRYTHFIEPLSEDEVAIYGYFGAGCDELSFLEQADSLEEALEWIVDDVNESLVAEFNWRDLKMLRGDYAAKRFAEHRPQYKKLKVTTQVKVEVVCESENSALARG